MELAEHLEQTEYAPIDYGSPAMPSTEYIPLIRNGKIPPYFNMGSFWHQTECGTAGCVAGHAMALWPSDQVNYEWCMDAAMDVLDLDEYEGEALFLRAGAGLAMQTTPQEAAQACRNLAAGKPLNELWPPSP